MSEKREPPPTWEQRKATIKHKWATPFQRIEWACEWAAYRMSHWAFIEVLEYGGKLAVVVTAMIYVGSCNERKQTADDAKTAKQYQAWQMIIAAEGKPASGGRIIALQSLLKDGVPLLQVNLSKAELSGISLTNAQLDGANFDEAKLYAADLSGSSLRWASMKNARLSGCNIKQTSFYGTDLRGADFNVTNWHEAESFQNANIANLFYATMEFRAFAKSNGAVEIASDQDWQQFQKQYKDNTIFDSDTAVPAQSQAEYEAAVKRHMQAADTNLNMKLFGK